MTGIEAFILGILVAVIIIIVLLSSLFEIEDDIFKN